MLPRLSRASSVSRRQKARHRRVYCFRSSSGNGECRFCHRLGRGSARHRRATRQHGADDRSRARNSRRELRTFSTSRRWPQTCRGEFFVLLADCRRCARRLQLTAVDISDGKGCLSRVFCTRAVFSPPKTGGDKATSSFNWIMKIPTIDLFNAFPQPHTIVC